MTTVLRCQPETSPSFIALQLSLDGIPKNPGEQDDYIRNKGPIPQFNSEYGCIQDVIQFKTNDKALGMNSAVEQTELSIYLKLAEDVFMPLIMDKFDCAQFYLSSSQDNYILKNGIINIYF